LKVSGWLSCRLDGWISIYSRVRRLSRFGRDVNRAYLWIGAAIAAGALGTFLQAIGAARPENRALLAVGTLLTAVAVYFLWTGQRILSRQATAKPVLDVFVDGEKTLHVTNLGTVDLEDTSVDETSYELKTEPLPEGRRRLKITAIESFSKPSHPIFTQRRIPKAGGSLTFDLAKGPFPVHDGLPEMTSPDGRTVYCLRILFRNGLSKQRFVRYLLTVRTGTFLTCSASPEAPQWVEVTRLQSDCSTSGRAYVAIRQRSSTTRLRFTVTRAMYPPDPWL
jgi:hypothetical protein